MVNIDIDHRDFVVGDEIDDAHEMFDQRNEGDLPLFLQARGANAFYILEDGIMHIRLETMSSVDHFDVEPLEDGYVALVFSPGNYVIYHESELGDLTELVQSAEEMVLVRPYGFELPPQAAEDLLALSEEAQNEIRFGWVPNPIIVEAIESGDVHSVIVDFRGNPGGDPGHFYNLFNFLGENLPEGNLFTFFDQGSFSAATMAPNYLEYFGAISLGMPLSQNVIFHGFGGGVGEGIVAQHVLRHSEIYINIPDALSHIDEPWARIDLLGITLESFIEMFPRLEFYTIRPDIQVYHTIEHWINNYDPLLSHVRALLAS